MKLDVAKYSNSLVVLATIYNPSSDAAQTPSACTAYFYIIQGGVLTPHPTLGGGTAMTEQDAKQGIWGVVADVTGITISTLIVVVTATVGGVLRSAVKLLGDSGISVDASVVVGAPQITTTAGVEEPKKAGRPKKS